MNPQSPKQTPAASALAAAILVTEPQPVLLTVELFSQKHPAFSPAALRNLIFRAGPRQSSKGEIAGNGLLESGAIVRLGRRVLLDEHKFLAWVTQGGKSASAAERAAA